MGEENDDRFESISHLLLCENDRIEGSYLCETELLEGLTELLKALEKEKAKLEANRRI